MARENRTLRFKSISQIDVPHERSGKHKSIVTSILADLKHLKPGAALKVPLDQLGDSKANVRSALNRATRKVERGIATASDDGFLYVWNTGSTEPKIV